MLPAAIPYSFAAANQPISSYMSGKSCLPEDPMSKYSFTIGGCFGDSPLLMPNISFPTVPTSNSVIGGCFGGIQAPRTDCFTPSGSHKPHHGGYHHRGFNKEFSHFASQHSVSNGLGKYSESSYTSSGTMPQNCFGNVTTTANQPAFVTDMLQNFQKAFGGMGSIFGAGTATTDYSQSTIPFTLSADANATSLPSTSTVSTDIVG